MISEHSPRPSCIDDRESLEGFNTELQVLGTLSSNGSHSSRQYSPQMVFNHYEVDGCSTPGALVHPAIKVSPFELVPHRSFSPSYINTTEGTLATSSDHQDCLNTNSLVSPISNPPLDTSSNCRSCQSVSLSVGRPSSSLSSSRPSSSISMSTVALNPDYRPISVADDDDPKNDWFAPYKITLG